ncbi:MAG: magnesium-translocating P-type ATPase [Butyrivibrio sp.]|jgi:Mg2+-importing ATPase|nr:magnesium-translocating P-type ATPase [Butyrivibrio sp.]
MKNAKSQRASAQLEAVYRKYAAMKEAEVLSAFKTDSAGLSAAEAQERLEQYGPNQVQSSRKTPWYVFLLKSFLDEFILVLLFLGVVSFFLKDRLGAGIIFLLAVISAVIRFVQDYNAYLASEKLRTMIHSHVDVRRDGKTVKADLDQVVAGDIIELGSGSIVPADLYLLSARDLFISQSMFTGESLPVEKKAGPCDTSKDSAELENICLMGCDVRSGSGVGVVIQTGRQTYLGSISVAVESSKGKTNFEKGLDVITRTMLRYMIIIVLCVFVINGFVKKDWLSAFMFSISVAVGITPGMLPMIVNATLSRGAQFLAQKKTIVKNLSAIQNLGAIDVLCTDKTGTLTADDIVLQRYLDADGRQDRRVLDYVYLNSYFSTGIKNLIDHAVLEYGEKNGVRTDVTDYTKIDEIPFDYDRRRMSVVIQGSDGQHWLISKGAAEEIVRICTFVRQDENNVPLGEDGRQKILQNAAALGEEGMHVIAVAEKHEQIDVSTFSGADEKDMTFLGYVAFLDPPKPDVEKAVSALYEAGVDVKVLSGDAEPVVANICGQVGIRRGKSMTGEQVEALDDAALKGAVECTNIFARLAPMQKQRVVDALRANGHVVGYMGDGVNDAPSLRHADVGISVDTATDVAKESSDIILLEKSLSVLKDGVYEGRRIYGNIMKYMKMALSGNFGNVFSVLVASIFLPFLPMIPIQMLIQNLIYDFTQIAIPWDNVDSEFMQKPKRWDTRSLSHFMNVLGPVSSVFDVLTFAVLWFVLGYCSADQQVLFQTGWFMEGLISQTLIVHFIRTSKVPFIQSCADIRMIFSSFCGIVAALFVPYVLHPIVSFHFAVMPMGYYGLLVLILLLYATAIEAVKRVYIRKNGEWL